jgi:hypothetical protein
MLFLLPFSLMWGYDSWSTIQSYEVKCVTMETELEVRVCQGERSRAANLAGLSLLTLYLHEKAINYLV